MSAGSHLAKSDHVTRPRETLAWGIVAVLAALAVVIVILGIALGSTWLAPEKVVAVLLGSGERKDQLIVLQLRTPRVAIAVLSGGAIAVAGYLLQKVTRNSLASPGVLGVLDGAALGVIIFLAVFSNESNALVIPIQWQPVAALIGAVLAIAAVFILSGNQASSAIRLLMFGIAVAAVAKAATMILMLVGPIYRTTQAARWIAGSVNEINWTEVSIVFASVVPLLLLVLAISRHLRPADLDEVSVRGIGLNLPVFRIFVFFLAAALTAVAVCFVGAVGFVGLMAPHMARMLVGRAVVPAVIASFLLGAIMLTGADLIVRALFAPTEVPAGTVTAVVGTPYFLYLLMRKEKTSG
jgi:ABC-type Fe3+-siderophore transport system, permease component